MAPLADDAPSAHNIDLIAQEVLDMAHRTGSGHRNVLHNAMQHFLVSYRKPRQAESSLTCLLSTVRPFRFLDLLAELRATIYKLVLVEEGTAMIDGECDHHLRRSGKQPELTRVNRQTRSEALDIFYGLNDFEAHIQRCDFSFLIGYMNAIGQENCKRMQRLELHLKDRWTCGERLKDLVRWAVTTHFDIRHFTSTVCINVCAWYKEHDSHYNTAPNAVNPIDGYMVETKTMLWKAFDLADDLRLARETSEMYVRTAFQQWLEGNEYGCDCVIHNLRRYSLGGFCTSPRTRLCTLGILSNAACQKARRVVEVSFS
ncbi:hypothetical protein DOTSEDRAFT_34458 [Dothistroma septosporum NZE10]|uniref:Uncharacterized protein n=1 Tax=Dothistroma septosporum (strain NZE10 / CBS 128990) TaxID=675120 RepID=N1PKM0_DOTSN|nr:hypothetical protein DOTSEDRAFT_34458 [Dothistroma septosporum NZE10]